MNLSEQNKDQLLVTLIRKNRGGRVTVTRDELMQAVPGTQVVGERCQRTGAIMLSIRPAEITIDGEYRVVR